MHELIPFFICVGAGMAMGVMLTELVKYSRERWIERKQRQVDCELARMRLNTLFQEENCIPDRRWNGRYPRDAERRP